MRPKTQDRNPGARNGFPAFISHDSPRYLSSNGCLSYIGTTHPLPIYSRTIGLSTFPLAAIPPPLEETRSSLSPYYRRPLFTTLQPSYLSLIALPLVLFLVRASRSLRQLLDLLLLKITNPLRPPQNTQANYGPQNSNPRGGHSQDPPGCSQETRRH